MMKQSLGISNRNTLVAVIASFTLVSGALAQRAGAPPVPGQSPGDIIVGSNDFQFDAKNGAAVVTELQKTSRVDALLKQIEAPAGVASQLKIKDARQELKADRVEKDQGNKWHVRFTQVYKGIPVKDGIVSFHQDEAKPNAELIWHGTYQADPEVDVTPKISQQQAIAVAEAAARALVRPRATAASTDLPNPVFQVQEKPNCDDPRNCASPSASTAALEIHPGKGPGQRVLTYHVTARDFSGAEPVILEAWVDNSGHIVESYNNVQTACSDGVGLTFYQGPASYFKVAFWPAYAVYVLNDNCLRIGTYDMYQTTTSTYQSSSATNVFGNYTLANRNSTNADAHYSTVQTDSFMYWVLGRDWVDGAHGPKVYQSVDGLGALISLRNHYGYKYNNAFWDGKMINLGDGDGVTFRSFATLDIIGHEWHHGVTQFTANLTYLNESGALNESFSDIFGAMTERYWKGESANTWKLGEGAYTPAISTDALRYMDRPTLDGSSRDHYSQRYVGTFDNGGVHWNSGIQNNAFYLVSKGGCHRFAGCMSGSIGASAATQIFYRALRYYMISSDGFSWARQCTLWAAEDLYGKYSYNWYRTQQAWNLVGVPKIID